MLMNIEDVFWNIGIIIINVILVDRYLNYLTEKYLR